MKGTLIIIKPTFDPVITDFERPLDLQTLKDAIGGGYIEAVSGFDTLELAGQMHRCAAFCDEDGKRKQLPLNPVADSFWSRALARNGRRRSHPGDYLCGQIAIVYGDTEFMAAL